MYNGINRPARHPRVPALRPDACGAVLLRSGQARAPLLGGLRGITRPNAAYEGAAGFTLVELMVVITVAAILLAIGIPSFKTITTASRISGEVNGLLGDMQFARAEAIKEGQQVMICISSTGTTCDSGNTAWQSGWIVFPVDTSSATPGQPDSAAVILRTSAAFGNTDTFVDTASGGPATAVTFDRQGLVNGLNGGNGALITLHESTSNVHYTRCLEISTVGAMKVVQNSSYGSCT